MKKIIIRTVIGIGAIIAIILIFATTKPDTFTVQRSIVINASPEKIASYIADFHEWTEWSPFEKMDPAMKRTFSGPEKGLGAVYEWNGDSHAGSGRMEIIDTTGSKITIKLDFTAPFEAHNTALFVMEPGTGGTKVTWEMYGPSNYPSKVMSVFFSMDAMVGKEFESGLASLKAIAES